MNGNYTVAEVVDDGIGNAILVAFAPKIPAFLSVVGSYVMMREIAWILLHRNKHRGPKEERISHPILCTLFSICLADIFYSLPFIFTTWAAPSHIDDPLLWGNVGSTATCTAQGFVLHLGAVSSPMFNFLQAFLSVFFVKYSWSEARVAVLEQRFQIGLWTFALLTATVPLFLNMYNNGYVVCWLHSYPMGCKDSLTYGKDEANCERGDNAWLWGLIFAFFPRWPALLGGAVCMFIIYRAVRQMENRLARYAGASVAFATTNTCNSLEESTKNLPPPTQIHQTVSRERSHRVAIQAYLYILAYMGCQALNAINCYIWFAMHTYNEFFDVVTYAIAPSQGFWNFLIFCRTRPEMHTWEGKLLWQAWQSIRSHCCCDSSGLCCCSCGHCFFCFQKPSSDTDASSSVENSPNSNSHHASQDLGSSPSSFSSLDLLSLPKEVDSNEENVTK